MIIFAKPAVAVLFQRGAFDQRATDYTSIILIYLSFQLFFSYAAAIMLRLIIVFQDMRIFFFISMTGIALNLILNYIFIKTITPPAAGIALSASVGGLILVVISFLVLKKRLKFIHGLSIMRSLSRFSLLSGAAGIIMYSVYKLLNGLITHTFVSQVTVICVSAAAGYTVYAALAYMLKVEEIGKLIGMVRTKLRAQNT